MKLTPKTLYAWIKAKTTPVHASSYMDGWGDLRKAVIELASSAEAGIEWVKIDPSKPPQGRVLAAAMISEGKHAIGWGLVFVRDDKSVYLKGLSAIKNGQAKEYSIDNVTHYARIINFPND